MSEVSQDIQNNARTNLDKWKIDWSQKPYIISADSAADQITVEVFYRIMGVFEASVDGMPFPCIRERLGKSWIVMLTAAYELDESATDKIYATKTQLMISAGGVVLVKPEEWPTPAQWVEMITQVAKVVNTVTTINGD